MRSVVGSQVIQQMAEPGWAQRATPRDAIVLGVRHLAHPRSHFRVRPATLLRRLCAGKPLPRVKLHSPTPAAGPPTLTNTRGTTMACFASLAL